MSNKRNMGPENNNQPKMPKFNMNWIYIAILSALLLVFVMGGGEALGGGSIRQEATYTTCKQ